MKANRSTQRFVLVVLVALLALASTSQVANAATYRGGGKGIHVEFRVRHQRIVFGKVSTVLYCTSSDGTRHLRRLRDYFGVHGIPSDATAVNMVPIPIKRSGTFLYVGPHNEEPSGFTEEVLTGRVGGSRITGQFRYLASYSPGCRTGGYQSIGSRNLRKDFLQFRALRHGK